MGMAGSCVSHAAAMVGDAGATASLMAARDKWKAKRGKPTRALWRWGGEQIWQRNKWRYPSTSIMGPLYMNQRSTFWAMWKYFSNNSDISLRVNDWGSNSSVCNIFAPLLPWGVQGSICDPSVLLLEVSLALDPNKEYNEIWRSEWDCL